MNLRSRRILIAALAIVLLFVAAVGIRKNVKSAGQNTEAAPSQTQQSDAGKSAADQPGLEKDSVKDNSTLDKSASTSNKAAEADLSQNDEGDASDSGQRDKKQESDGVLLPADELQEDGSEPQKQPKPSGQTQSENQTQQDGQSDNESQDESSEQTESEEQNELPIVFFN